MARNRRPEDFNAFGYDPRGGVANAAALLFGENWRPDPAGLPQYAGPQVAAPRFGPPAAYQVPHLPPNYVPQNPFGGYLGALQYHQREGPWANYPVQGPAAYQPAQYPPHPPPLAAQGMRPVHNGAEVRPGVFRMIARLSNEKVQKEFTFESDIDYIDFRSRACANLGIKEDTAELGYRISGQEGPRTNPSELQSADQFVNAMQRISALIQRARSKEYGIEVVNLKLRTKVTASKSKNKKRRREDDIPSEALATDTLTAEYKKLANHIKCKSCKGHCHVMRNGSHQRLDYKEMSYWAKQNTLGNSTIYEPPEALSFDRRPKRARPNSSASSSKGEIHIHNHFDALQFGGSVLGNNSNPRKDTTASPRAITPRLPSPSPAPFPLNSSFFAPTSPPPDLQENTVDILLSELDKAYSTSKYSAMSQPLLDAGLRTAKNIIAREVRDIITWTGLPADDLFVLHEYAVRRVGLDHIGGKSIPDPVASPAAGDSESEVDSEIVDSSESDDHTD